MEQSEKIEELAKALVAFQGEINNVKKDADNTYFKSKYAPLETIIETIRPVLLKNGLSFSQMPNGENELTTILLHMSGQYLKSTSKIFPRDKSPQSQGSAITYMRRYALSAILGIATEEDDDGNAASTPPKQEQKETNKKVEIMRLLYKLGAEKGQTAEKCKIMVKSFTSLDLTEENFDEIIGRLGLLVSEIQ